MYLIKIPFNCTFSILNWYSILKVQLKGTKTGILKVC